MDFKMAMYSKITDYKIIFSIKMEFLKFNIIRIFNKIDTLLEQMIKITLN